jgi:hypothetical protein
MNKEQKLKLIRGLHAKTLNLRALTRDHFNADGWDTEENGKKAARLLDEIIDMSTLIRNELT